MSPKTTLALALAAGFLGGTLSQRLIPTPVHAQDIPQAIRAHKFVLVDDQGVSRGVFGFPVENNPGGYPAIELLNPKGKTSSFTVSRGFTPHVGLLPDSTFKPAHTSAP
jgi:hypothetical protein